MLKSLWRSSGSRSRRLPWLLEVVDNRCSQAPELFVPSLPLSNVVIRVQGFLDEVGKLGEALLKPVRDERPFQADFERRRHLRVLRLDQEMLVELRAPRRTEQVDVSVELWGDLTLIEDRCQKLIQVTTTDAASFDRR